MKNNLLILIFSFTLTACGGGSSSSGGEVAPPVLAAQVGSYVGTSTITLSSEGRPPFTDEIDISFSVSGPAGRQQVFLAYREFSGSSALDPDLRFTIPSGTLRIPLGNGQSCVGQITYVGQFVGSTVTGMETGSFTCPDALVINYSGMFEATFSGSAKLDTSNLSVFPEAAR